jgi:hypothetical protein
MMVQVTERDDAMMAWLDVVRMADTEAIRYALAGMARAEVMSCNEIANHSNTTQ